MRIAIFGIKSMPAFAGADRVAERLAEALPEYEYVIYVLRDALVPASAPNRRYVRVPALPGKHLRAFSYFLLSSLHFALRGKADVAHVHNSDFGLFVPILKLRRVPVIGTFHGTHLGPAEREKWGRGARVFFRYSERTFVKCCDELTSVAPLPPLLDREIRHIPNGADPWEDPEPDGELPMKMKRGEYVLFACGRLDRTKGLHHLLTAYRGLQDAPPLLVVGDFSHDPRYSAEIQEQAMSDPRVLLHRSLLGRDELFRLVGGARLFVFPSEFEAMSMMLLEAIACGAVVVCSDIPENVATVGEDYPLLFPSRDPDQLREVLGQAVGGSAADVAGAVLDRARATFRWDAIARSYAAAYRDARNRISAKRSATRSMSNFWR